MTVQFATFIYKVVYMTVQFATFIYKMIYMTVQFATFIYKVIYMTVQFATFIYKVVYMRVQFVTFIYKVIYRELQQPQNTFLPVQIWCPSDTFIQASSGWQLMGGSWQSDWIRIVKRHMHVYHTCD